MTPADVLWDDWIAVLVTWTPRKAGRGGYFRSRAAWVRWDDMAAVLDIAADLEPIASLITLTLSDARRRAPAAQWTWSREWKAAS